MDPETPSRYQQYMLKQPNIVTGLEIGTSKVCVVIGERKIDGTLNILGVGQSVSRGVRNGEIVNPKEVEEDVRAAISKAEKMSNVKIRSVYLGVTGSHIEGFNNRGGHQIVPPDREIFQEDVVTVLSHAKKVNYPLTNKVIHSIQLAFTVDGEPGFFHPVGNHGSKLEVDMHLIAGKTKRFQNSVQLIRSMALGVDDIVFNGYASGIAMLTTEQKELGALVIDIGAGTTEFVAIFHLWLQFSGVLTVGGNDITNDLVNSLKLSVQQAEKLKLDHGSAIVSDESRGQEISVKDEQGKLLQKVNAGDVQMIVGMRLEEIFMSINKKLTDAGIKPHLRAGIVLCGGTARVPGIVTLAERVFKINVTLGKPVNVQDFSQDLNGPEFATAIGLVKYRATVESETETQPSQRGKPKGVVGKLTAFLRGRSATVKAV